MKNLILENGLTVLIDDEDFEWAQFHSWKVTQTKHIHITTPRGDNPYKTTSLAREIATRVLGSEVVDQQATVINLNRNSFDCRRKNIGVRKTVRLTNDENVRG